MIKTPREEAFESLGKIKVLIDISKHHIADEHMEIYEEAIKSIEVYIIEQSCNCYDQ